MGTSTAVEAVTEEASTINLTQSNVLGSAGSSPSIANATADAEAGTSTAITNATNTGRYVPESLQEQLAMQQVVTNPAEGTTLSRITMTDPRWPAADGWVKMAQNINGVEIHYVYNTETGAAADFKFK